MSRVFNPTRRNRNIGTAFLGHGQDNRASIPRPRNRQRDWAEQIGTHHIFRQTVSRRELVFIVEDTHGGCTHACSINDICYLLAHVPAFDWHGLSTFVLRQPTAKQRMLRPAWGRLFYDADMGSLSGESIHRGPAILLDAVNFDARLVWSKSLRPDDQEELKRLLADGHRIISDGRRHVLTVSQESVRATQLYRTLLHEIGHWVDFRKKVTGPADAGGDFVILSQLYFARRAAEREAFAHRFADATRAHLQRFGVIPFAPR